MDQDVSTTNPVLHSLHSALDTLTVSVPRLEEPEQTPQEVTASILRLCPWWVGRAESKPPPLWSLVLPQCGESWKRDRLCSSKTCLHREQESRAHFTPHPLDTENESEITSCSRTPNETPHCCELEERQKSIASVRKFRDCLTQEAKSSHCKTTG